MTWRVVVVSSRAKLDLKLGYMVVRSESVQKVHLSEISMVIIENSAVSITGCLLAELAARKIKVLFCDNKRNPCAEFIPCYGSHDSSLKIRRQIHWSEETKGAVWTQLVSEKIRQQMEFLSSLGREEAAILQNYIHELAYNDETNREAHAAKVYFNALFGKKFSRDHECALNAALNYGYAILLSAFNREIVSGGYITQLGICHDNVFNPFNLASDLMEPFRPLVDRQAYKMNPEVFETAQKREMLTLLNFQVIIAEKSHYLLNAVAIYCKSVLDALSNDDPSRIRFYRNEL